MKKALFTLLLFGTFCLFAQAQKVEVRPAPNRVSNEAVSLIKSPLDAAFIKKGDAYVKVIYSRPHLRSRTMLGEKEPYGKVWRLGANAATEIFLSKDITIAGKKLSAGMYSFYAIPNKDKWTLIFNTALGQWGAYSYDQSKDALRVDVPVQKSDKKFEAFTIWFTPDNTALNMAWDNVHVSAPLSL